RTDVGAGTSPASNPAASNRCAASQEPDSARPASDDYRGGLLHVSRPPLTATLQQWRYTAKPSGQMASREQLNRLSIHRHAWSVGTRFFPKWRSGGAASQACDLSR